MGTAQRNRELVERVYKHFFAGDLDGFFSLLDEDCTLIEPASLPYGGTFRGISNVKAAILKMGATWNDISLDFEETLASDTLVVAVTTFHATAAATGKKVSFPMIEIWGVKGDKITSIRPVYGDTALALKALNA